MTLSASNNGLCWSWLVPFFFFCLFVTTTNVCTAQQRQETTTTVEYAIVGVSGGLQDGFPEHVRLDYRSGDPIHEVQAIYVGRGLVRGYKAFLDVMQEGWRQYTKEDNDDSTEQPLINSNVFASGCYEHANEYWVYLVDTRQVLTVLNHEPRFLSIAPDTGKVELDATETTRAVQQFLGGLVGPDQDHKVVSIPLVTAVWFQYQSHVPSPILRTHNDGTEVTNFPESLALWAGVNDNDKTAVADTTRRLLHCRGKQQQQQQTCPSSLLLDIEEATFRQEAYWKGIRDAIRRAETKRPTSREEVTYGPPFRCQRYVEFGAKTNTARLNYPLTKDEVERRFHDIGYQVDFANGEIIKKQ